MVYDFYKFLHFCCYVFFSLSVFPFCLCQTSEGLLLCKGSETRAVCNNKAGVSSDCTKKESGCGTASLYQQEGKSVLGSRPGPVVRNRDGLAITWQGCRADTDLRPSQGSQARGSTGKVQDRAQAQLLHSCNAAQRGQWYSHSSTALLKEQGAGPHFYLFSQLLIPAEDLALDSASSTLT